MYCFLPQSFLQDFGVWGKPIELLPQAMCGYHSAGPANLRLAENEGKNRDIEIDHGDAQNAPRVPGHVLLHALENLRRVILLALAVISELGIEAHRDDLTRHGKGVYHGRRQVVQQAAIELSERQQLEKLHRVPTVGLLQPYRFSL